MPKASSYRNFHKRVHANVRHHVHKNMGKHVLKHAHKVSHHVHKAHHGLMHMGELILVGSIGFMSLMFAGSSNLPNNISFTYPLQMVSTLECRTLYRNDMPDSCKINLPRIHGANYDAYKNNELYRSIYTVLRAAPYSDSWNQKLGAHAGLDIATARGTPLYSIGEGEVYSAGRNSAYGNVIKIKYVYQGEIVYAIYSHMDSMDVKKGDKVGRGQRVGAVGNSGNTFGALGGYHVHFEIDKDNYGRPAYSYTNCPDLSKGHYKIIQNGLCRNELFSYQYDPIRLFESNSTYVHAGSDDPKVDDNNGGVDDQNNTDGDNNNDNDDNNIDDSSKNDNNDNNNVEDKDDNTNNIDDAADNILDDKGDDTVDKWKDVIDNSENNDDNIGDNTDDISNNDSTNNNIDDVVDKWKDVIDDSKVTEDNIGDNTESTIDNNLDNNLDDQSGDVNNNDNTDTTDPIENHNNQNPETIDDKYLLELDFDGINTLAEHFIKLWDVEMRSELKERNLLLGETLTLDIEIFKKGAKLNNEKQGDTRKNPITRFNGVLQLPFVLITTNDNIDINVNYLKLITKGEAQVEITGKKSGVSHLIIEFGDKKIGILDVTVN